jgi:hypothetical protein
LPPAIKLSRRININRLCRFVYPEEALPSFLTHQAGAKRRKNLGVQFEQPARGPTDGCKADNQDIVKSEMLLP